MKPFVCLLAVVAAFCGTSHSTLVIMPEDAIRAQNKAGATDFNFIMNLMLMGMSDSMVDKARREMQAKFGNGAQAPEIGPNDPQFGSDDPIELKKRKKRSFDDPFFKDFNNGFKGFDQGGYDQNNYDNTNTAAGGNNFISYPGYDQNYDNINTDAGGNNYIYYPGENQDSSSNNYYSSKSSSHNSYGWGRRLICPRQVDQGRVYNYGNDPAVYPVVDIGQELFVRSLPGSDLLFQSLSRHVVFPTDPPQIFQDEFLATSNATCRTAEDQVWSYDSVVYTGKCYPLVNFQETPFFTTCLNRFCKNCQPSSSYYYYYYRANICITEYRQVSLWVYCESLLPNRRIVKDRILVPTSCTCTTVKCQDAWRRGRRSRSRSRW